MNSFNKNRKVVNKDDRSLKKSQKHDVNLQKNSTMYFQIGLIISLLATYFLMDMKFLAQDFAYNGKEYEPEIGEVFNPDIKIYVEPVIEPVVEIENPPVVIKDKFKPVANDFVLKKEVKLITQEQNTTDKPHVNVEKPTTKVTNNIMNIDLVEQVPIFPGCEGLSSNLERKQCMNDKIAKLVRRKFDTSVGESIGLKGKQKFYVQFKIDQTGSVTEIRTNSKHNLLDKEAKRVIGKIPKMQPGKQHNTNVSVIYNLPINFQMVN